MCKDKTELDRILTTTKLYKLELLDFLLRQPNMLQELLGIGMAPNNDTVCTLGLAPYKGSKENCAQELTLTS